MSGITVRVSMVDEALLCVGSERAAIDTAMKILRNADGTPLDRRTARAVVRAVRAADAEERATRDAQEAHQ